MIKIPEKFNKSRTAAENKTFFAAVRLFMWVWKLS
jgi:hypothetical protein